MFIKTAIMSVKSFLHSILVKKLYGYGLGDSRHAIFILYPIVNYRKVNEMCSMISRICAKNDSVACIN